MFPSASPRGTLRVLGKQNSLFPLGPVIKCLLFYVKNPPKCIALWDGGLANSLVLYETFRSCGLIVLVDDNLQNVTEIQTFVYKPCSS